MAVQEDHYRERWIYREVAIAKVTIQEGRYRERWLYREVAIPGDGYTVRYR